MKIGILKGSSTNQVLSTFADHLAGGITVNGHEAGVFDVTRDDVLAELVKSLKRDRYDAVISFNAMLGELKGPDQRGLMEVLGIPFIGWLVDHPAYHYHRLTTQNNHRWTLCPSPDHIRFLQGAGVTGLWQNFLAAANPVVSGIPDFSDRRIPIMFAATWMREPDKFWERIQSETTRSIIESVMERVMDDGSVSVTQAFSDVLKTHELPLHIDASVAKIHAAILYYVRKHDRITLVRQLAKSGLPVTLVGKGWRENLTEHGRLSFRDDLPSEQLASYYAEAKFVLNINAANGASERAFAAMQAGACVLSDQNELLAAAADPGSDILFFDRRKPEVLTQVLGDLLESGAGEDIALHGMAKAMAQHTWAHRAAQLLQWVGETADTHTTELETA